MAVLEVYTVSLMSKQGLGVLVFVIGTGGGLGSICATYIHNRVTSEKE
jgi:predicted MFS family arabinose efflux permease